ncbi:MULTISPECIES: response regulator transcription factor [Bacillota]|uniref:Stage 0 sporulation protein A homolog n=1 Tax=Irregularibacter muris TaxID=1796619 RepID=A0AAE3HFK8_9FIRM|nr:MULTISPECIES: response regulator transcription factor [Bacillota]MCR1899231.1 response regulator transcription factor [Irregularibacter muris]WIV12876.1 response regulator transcription factor [Proteiniborus sp. MB09-C3]
MKQKILIIDDDIELCALVERYLETEGYVVTTKHNGADGLTEGLTTSYQLVVLDVMLPQKNGFDVLSDLRKTSSVPVLMLTAKDSEIDKVLGLRLGADDYLTKPFSMNEFVARVQSIIRRYTTLGGESVEESASMLTFDNLSIAPATREVIASGATVDLTAKEFDLLYFLAKNSGRVFTKKQIYRAVWKDEYAFDDNNIMVHIRRLRKKIEPNPEQPQFIQTVWGVGYKFDGRSII